MTLAERKSSLKQMPPDQMQREQALAPDRSVLVQAPAGSGKTDLLTRRFLRLLAEVEDPAQIVAITFTKAAAAEMRHRILSEIEKAAAGREATADEFAMETLATRALERSQRLEWNLLELSSQLRISTIDSFCRELALRQPLLSGLGGGLDIAEQPEELYRRAARNTIEALSAGSAELQAAVEALLTWRDNNWKDVEDQLVEMLAKRDRWMQDFVLAQRQYTEQDWDTLRAKLEWPFANAVVEAMGSVALLLDENPSARDEALALARFACEQKNYELYASVAELAELPRPPFSDAADLEAARHAYLDLAELLLTNDGEFRSRITVTNGFPADAKKEKQRFAALVNALKDVAGFAGALAGVRELPPARYTEDDWRIVRACFTLLRHAAAELRVGFAEAGVVDYTEVAQTAQRVLLDEDGPTEAALAVAEEIHHLLVDEFQDTSRKQHRLIASLVAPWSDLQEPGAAERTAFVVGDPMQSIYFFRDADAELFPRVQKLGLELASGDSHRFDFAPLSSNFRTSPALVNKLNEAFAQVFDVQDGSGITFSEAKPARAATDGAARLHLHLDFVPEAARIGSSADEKKQIAAQREAARDAQVREIVDLAQSHAQRMEEARQRGDKYRIALLGRTRSALAPIAAALREAAIPFRAVDLESLSERPEVLDALALARALKDSENRVAWLGVLRAPWCGLSLADLYTLTSADDAELRRSAVPELLCTRAHLLSGEGQQAIARLTTALKDASSLPVSALGTWLEQIWLRLGGADCVDATARANLDLLWRCLDKLADGDADLLGPALDAALEKLTAQPDPAAENNCGVQLMTIHKSKGLEFEVVIVPELQAGSAVTHNRMMAWLERGVADSVETSTDEITEFLVAPQQPKGADRGLAKTWVDGEQRKRERQEMRRILYVAATRAREELHLFARPAYKEKQDGRELAEPTGSLLATAWPALREEVQARFAAWNNNAQEAEIEAVAAAASKILVMPAQERPTVLHRLPADYEPPTLASLIRRTEAAGPGAQQLYTRHEGGLLSRALGTAVHALLEEMARLRTTQDWDAARKALGGMVARIASQIRAAGVERAEAEKIGAEALAIALRASEESIAQWILSPHVEAASETRWAGVLNGKLRTVQADRVFRGGPQPETDGESVWWIVDYKTTHADAELPELRKFFAQQLELYARVLRLLHGDGIAIRAGLYYPRMSKFDWWEM